jgi:hypothetical protein
MTGPVSTILSICPFETVEIKPINAGYFKIPAAEKDNFILMEIRESSYIQRLPATDHNIVIPVASHHIAKSIVDDFINTVIEADDNAGPGMMWFPGVVTRLEVTTKHKDALQALKERQIRWFENLCKKADDDWNQYHKLGLISGHQRYAASYLGYKADWIVEYNQGAGMIDCPACFTQVDARAAICIHCKAILNREKAISFGLIPPVPQLPAPVEKVAAKV